MAQPSFNPGEKYSRHEIYKEVGGGTQTMLPTVDGVVVCCCIREDLSKQAVKKLLIGDFPKQYPAAKQWATDKQTIPLFLKRDSGKWEYIGLFRVSGSTEDPDVVEQEKLAGNGPQVKIVLYLEAAGI